MIKFHNTQGRTSFSCVSVLSGVFLIIGVVCLVIYQQNRYFTPLGFILNFYGIGHMFIFFGNTTELCLFSIPVSVLDTRGTSLSM